MGRIEVMTILEDVDDNVGKARSQSLGDSRIEVGITAAADGEVDRTVEPAEDHRTRLRLKPFRKMD